MTAYIDSSVVLRHILNGEDAIRHALACDRIVSSELLEIECRRVIHRCRMEGGLDDDGLVEAMRRLTAVLDGMSLLVLSSDVKNKAMEAFPVSVKTLDALHLASVTVLAHASKGDIISVFSHDTAMNRCAAALGFPTPLSP